MIGADRTLERIRLLEGRIRHYDWGSRTMLARLQGRALPSRPEAELWLGTHAAAPSRIDSDAGWVPLPEWIARDPVGCLGVEVVERFGAELPFLLKILAVEAPLSLQAHPDADRAKAGFEREHRAGLALEDPCRSYRDPRPKPELVCALTRFEALVGFRAPRTIARRLRALGLESLLPEREPDQPGPAALRPLLGAWLALEPTALGSALARLDALGLTDAAMSWIPRLQASHPDDPAVLAPLFLRHFVLQPGQALFLPPGRLHCYLEGAAVEIMASSDNVVRAGLTRKPRDLAELLEIVRFEPGPVRPLRPVPGRTGEHTYPCSVAEFALSVLRPGAAGTLLEPTSAEILLCVEGEVRLSDRPGQVGILRAGASAFVPASASAYRVEGEGLVYRARSPRAPLGRP